MTMSEDLLELADLMRHAVGFFSTRPGHRNHYCSSAQTPAIRLGLANGLLEATAGIETVAPTYRVTEKGQQFIGLEEMVRHQDERRFAEVRSQGLLCDFLGFEKEDVEADIEGLFNSEERRVFLEGLNGDAG